MNKIIKHEPFHLKDIVITKNKESNFFNLTIELIEIKSEYFEWNC